MRGLSVLIFFIILSGYRRSGTIKNQEENLFDAISRNDWSFDQTCWKDISVDAKSLIKGLMEPDVEKRYTVKQALQHKWCAETASESSARDAREPIAVYAQVQKSRTGPCYSKLV